ncbi:MAG: glycoside hydrolase family 38 N-terminal domain-containing protein [Actinomycetes bacterium]
MSADIVLGRDGRVEAGDGAGRAADVYLVPHTHWDREWYEPFQRFRLRLVDLMDDVTARAQREPGFCFTMDGQMAAVDDYLEVRPEQREVVRSLVASGQLAVGPWRVLLDEFLCSGENIVRNLEMGWRAAAELGEPMAVGYLPDMFGHCAQMPQILALAGLRHACVWRGVPASVDRHSFTWRAPDGTGIRTEYLPGGYGNAADLFAASVDHDLEGSGDTAAVLSDRLRSRVATLAGWFGDDPFLAMYGTDHAAPLPTLMQQVALLSQAQGTRLQVCTLGDYVLARDPAETGLPVVEGELRSHARANILPGVISVRWHLKEAMARAEKMVERYAEPFAALWSADWPTAYLQLAWQRLVDASCHDSVTGCGVDETALQVAARIAEAEHAGQAVRDRAAAALARSVAADSVLVLNPTAARRDALVVLDVPAPDDWASVDLLVGGDQRVPTQEVERNETLLADEQVDAAELATVFRRVHDRELFGKQITHLRLDGPSRSLDFRVANRPGDQPFDVAVEQQRAADAAASHPGPWRVRTIDEPRRRLVAQVTVPPLGWTTAKPIPGGGAAAGDVAVSVDAVSVDADGKVTNGLLSVAVRDDGALRLEAADGTVLDGVGRLVDGGDCGDSYNYAPPAADVLVDEPEHVAVEVLERGPLRALVLVTRRVALPARLDGDARSSRLEPVDVVTLVELRSGEAFVRLYLRWENRSQDHRLRLHVPLGRPATTSHAEGQFAVVERGLEPEGGTAGEYPIATYPASGFVDAGGAGVLLGRTVEYELLDGELAITLLRAVGWLSRNVHPYRDEPAGPQMETPEAQVLGPAEMSLAVLPHAGSWQGADLVGALEVFRHELVTQWGSGPDGVAGSSGEGLSVAGDGVVLSSLRRRGDLLELRVVAQTEADTAAVVGSAAVPVEAARDCDLLGRQGAQRSVEDGLLRLPLRPWQIATVQLRLTR